MQPLDLISTARRLVGKPRQADLKRALSTAYYALFHALSGPRFPETKKPGSKPTGRSNMVL
ncbi:MAG: hypothetical protein OXC82_09925 [Rhodobacteraceae bacterium]|nr:hypothetical protein [Paracoccaceae bacterium]MCY4250734.1 hypothetical protein [Paracoccaceae bacterium]MCY4306800.1 hypothetical protein [Paracoccaceae bacterium]